MTRDADHTPSPQSVVVPLEDWRHVIGALKNTMARLPMGAAIGNVTDALAKVEHLQAAPAPSSLAGGEMLEAAKRLGSDLDEGRITDFAVSRDIAIILAALSPEAPAREGVGEASTVPPPHWTDEDRYDRHPKAAEEWNWRNDPPLQDGGLALAVRRLNFATDRADPRAPDQMALVLRKDLMNVKHQLLRQTALADALRARSSAPEAREEALGNLLAVIHGDGGHRALEVGTKQAALEAEKIVANLLSSAPEAREGEAVACPTCLDTWAECPTCGGAHKNDIRWSAAPSADKLREDGK